MSFAVRRGQIWRPKAGRKGGAFTVRSLDRNFAYVTSNRSGVARRIKLARFGADYDLVREAPGTSAAPPVVRRAAPEEAPTCCGYPLAGTRCRVCGEDAEQAGEFRETRKA